MANRLAVTATLVCMAGFLPPHDRAAAVEAQTLAPAPSPQVPLTPEEQAWIADHPIIRLGIDPEFAPFEFIADDGSYQGMASDYVRILNERLGINMQVAPHVSWADISNLVAHGQIDVLPCVGKTAERAQHYLFSNPYQTFYRVIVARSDAPPINGIDDIRPLRVAVQQNSSHLGFLTDTTDITPRIYDTVQQTLAAVAGGEADVAVVNVGTASYWIRKLGLANLHIAAPVGEGNHLYFAVRSDWPELVSILNKGLATISETEASEIRERWVEVAVAPGVDWGRALRWSLGLIAAASVILILLALHNRALRREIETRRRAEAALREREAEYRTLVEGVNSAILRMTPDGTIVFMNSFGERFFGYAPGELVGKPVVGTIVPEVESQGRDLRALMEDLAANPDRHVANENENITKSGERVWVAWTNRPIYNPDGTLREILCVGSDLSARKRAEDDLKRYEFIANTVDDMMSVLDRHGRYEAVNAAWCTAMGVERSEVLGKSLHEVWPSELTAAKIAPWLEQCMAGAVVSHESVLNLPTRGERHCEVTMYPYINTAGIVTHAVVVTHDVTEWRTAQAALHEAKHAAEAASRAKSAFLANMSHEIRTPMNAILGYTQLLRRHTTLGPESQHALHAIARSGEHLLALINDVLEMSKIEAGRAELHPMTFNLRGLMADVDVMFVMRTNAKGLKFAIEIDDDVPPYIRADEARLRQVLINLIGNAVKFTDRGHITVRVSVDSSIDPGEPKLVIEVEDTGCGVAVDEIETIFESFQQAGAPDLRRGGTGLGLPICRAFAQMMGGDLTVESKLSAGSRFRFTMKLEPGDPADALGPEPEFRVRALQSGQGEIRVLVVDDRDTNRDLLRRLLEHVGFVVHEAADGREGVEMFQTWRPQVVLMDMVMPVMSGRDAVRAIRATPEGRTTTIIGITASTLDEELLEIVAHGADAVLRKPFREGELFALMHRYAHIQFEYEPDTAGSDDNGDADLESAAGDFTLLPADEQARLRHAIVTGSIDGVSRFAGDVRAKAPGLADVIERCAREFALDELEALVSAWGTNHE